MSQAAGLMFMVIDVQNNLGNTPPPVGGGVWTLSNRALSENDFPKQAALEEHVARLCVVIFFDDVGEVTGILFAHHLDATVEGFLVEQSRLEGRFVFIVGVFGFHVTEHQPATIEERDEFAGVPVFVERVLATLSEVIVGRAFGETILGDRVPVIAAAFDGRAEKVTESVITDLYGCGGHVVLLG